MTTKQLEKANNLIDKILQVRNQVHHQEIALKCLGQDVDEGFSTIDIKLDMGTRVIDFNVSIDDILPIIEISVVNQKEKIEKLIKRP